MFQGSMVALITPMNIDGSLDESALEALVEFHVENGTDAIVAMGTTGESATLTHREHRHVIKRVVEFSAGRVPIIAGTGSNSTREALELTAAAKQDGADACLLVTPYYNKPSQEGLYQHYKLIAEQVAIPQVLYNVPGRTACDLLPETVARLAEIPNIVGIKEATGDLDRAREILTRCEGGLSLFSGDDATAMELMLLGGKGDVSVTANVAPKMMHDMCEAAIAGDRYRAEELDACLQGLHESLFVEANPIPVKWAMHRMGFGADKLRLPLTPLSGDYRSSVVSAMEQAGISV